MVATAESGDDVEVRSSARRPDPPVPVVAGGHRPPLDGLRAVAVYLVVAFHAGIPRFAGGHIGVDVFFVLSGYLVTGVLLRDLASGDGGRRIRLGRFYARRARRLLPAAIVCLLITAVAFATFATTAEVLASERGFRFASLYLTNWYLIDSSTGYFATDTAHSPILHFWSLAVEEQFYLVWPLAFGGIAAAARAAGRHRWNVVRLVVGLLAAASAIWLFVLRGTDPIHAYYGTDVRAYQLLAGSLLALTPSLIAGARRLGRLNDLLAAGSIGGLVLISVVPGAMGPIARGYATTVITVVLILSLETGSARLPSRVLGSRSIAFLGAISYGTYLWHWPVVVIAGLVGEFTPIQLFVLSALLGTALAALSYELLEQPIRQARGLDRHTWPVAVAGLAASIVVGLVALPLITSPDERGGGRSEAAVSSAGFTPVPASFDYAAVQEARFTQVPPCFDKTPEACIRVRGSGAHIAMLGDSNSMMWVDAFRAIAEENDLTLSVLSQSGCRWQDGLYAASQKLPADIERCDRVHRFAYDEALPALRPDLLVVTNSAELEPVSTKQPDDPLARQIEQTTTDSLQRLSDQGINVLIVESKPLPTGGTQDPSGCLADAEFVEACRFTTLAEPSWIEALQRDLADRLPGVTAGDFDRISCPFSPICDPIIDDIAVYWDNKHVTPPFARHVAPQIEAYLRENGLVELG
jgi:peptidoglycan/LPS O-acetylase OafA/YrhL